MVGGRPVQAVRTTLPRFSSGPAPAGPFFAPAWQCRNSATTSPVEPGTIVFLAPEVRHAITAAPDSALEFYAVSTPAFSPEDYVPVKD